MKPTGLFVITRNLDDGKHTSYYYLYGDSQGMVIVYLCANNIDGSSLPNAEQFDMIEKVAIISEKQPYIEMVDNVLSNYLFSGCWVLEKYLTI